MLEEAPLPSGLEGDKADTAHGLQGIVLTPLAFLTGSGTDTSYPRVSLI